MDNQKPEYIELHCRIRCDGWWRKAVIGAVLFITAIGACSNFAEYITRT